MNTSTFFLLQSAFQHSIRWRMDENGFKAKLLREIQKYGTQKATAEALGISEQFLTDVLKGRRGPGPRLLKAMGLERRVEFVKR
jgi:hypothetical protein